MRAIEREREEKLTRYEVNGWMTCVKYMLENDT